MKVPGLVTVKGRDLRIYEYAGKEGDFHSFHNRVLDTSMLKRSTDCIVSKPNSVEAITYALEKQKFIVIATEYLGDDSYRVDVVVGLYDVLRVNQALIELESWGYKVTAYKFSSVKGSVLLKVHDLGKGRVANH